MNAFSKKLGVAILCSSGALFLSACGASGGSNDKNQAVGTAETKDTPRTELPKADDRPQENKAYPSLYFNQLAELPTCNAVLASALAYVKADEQFYVCTENKWDPVSIQGRDGTNGTNGTNGANGVDGRDGIDGTAGANGTSCAVSETGTITCGNTSYQIPTITDTITGILVSDELPGEHCASGGSKIEQYVDSNKNGQRDSGEALFGTPQYVCTDYNAVASTLYCSGDLESWPLTFTYSGLILESGDIHANATIYDSLSESGGSSFFSSQQVGAATAPVIFTMDLLGADNYGYWILSADRSTSVVTIEYHDLDLAGGLRTWTMDPESCVLNSYDDVD